MGSIRAGASLERAGRSGERGSSGYAVLRRVCSRAALDAERILPLLKTNLIALEDLDSHSESSIDRLRRAGLSDVEARTLLLELSCEVVEATLDAKQTLTQNMDQALRVFHKRFEVDADVSTAPISEGGLPVFHGSLYLPSGVASHVFIHLSLKSLGHASVVGKSWAHCLLEAEKGPDSPYRRHASSIAVSHTLVPSSWKLLMQEGMYLTRSMLQATTDLLKPVLDHGAVNAFGNGLEFTLPVSRDAAHDYCLDRWRIGIPSSASNNRTGSTAEASRNGVVGQLAPARQLSAGITLWCLAVPFFRSEQNQFGVPTASAFEHAFKTIKGWSVEHRPISQYTVLPPIASGTIGPFYATDHTDLSGAAAREGFTTANPEARPRFMDRTMAVLESCRLERDEAERHLIAITGGEGIPGIPGPVDWHSPDNASQFRCPVALNNLASRQRFARKLMSLVEGTKGQDDECQPATWHSNIYQGVRSRALLRGVAPWTWESPFTPPLPPYLGGGANAFLHYLDTGLIGVGEKHMVIFWARVPARHGYLLGMA